ncbi:endocuticle structural glycoprotein SgAbd-1-like isoform X1 [Macrosteles quadrilineatus]|uniref:endocuticle structural glycoprotein SgAbd-1-like isoform X1 n=1 Tax=Macrosteles quadrilineatus TaxID=74068 RepID=UPI0023E1DC2B|nr:endocuticle structural glycoprotein SgAbd-1-like isoform X1 [Macrosteles quadrilineatus]
MRAFGLVFLLATSALAAPQGESNEVDSSERKQPKARQLEQFVYQAPQYGAKFAPVGAQYTQGIPAGAQIVYLQGGYQQQQYVPGQQIAYIAGAPAQQTIVSGAPQTYYSGAYSTQFAQPQANVVAVKKTVVKPSYKVAVAPQPQVYKTVTSYKPQAAPAVYKVSAPAPAPAPVVKVSAPAPAVQYSAPHAEPVHVIVKQFEDNNFDGSFTYNYETDHGIAVESSGYLKNAGTENEIQVIQGSYTYYSPEGVPITTTYIADENGFQVQGDHLPVPPPLPEAIAKSIEYQRSLPPTAEEQTAAAARQ